MHEAACEGHTDIILELAKNGADVRCRSKLGHTPFHYAVHGKYIDAQKALLKLGIDENAYQYFLAHALRENNKDFACQLVDGFGVNKRISIRRCKGFTQLHDAVISDDLDKMKFLIARKADVNARAYVWFLSGYTPYMLAMAIGQKREKIASVLLEAGADETIMPSALGTVVWNEKRNWFIMNILNDKQKDTSDLVLPHDASYQKVDVSDVLKDVSMMPVESSELFFDGEGDEDWFYITDDKDEIVPKSSSEESKNPL
jgi:ankyrin repeat protein